MARSRVRAHGVFALSQSPAQAVPEGGDTKFVLIAKHRNIRPVGWLSDATGVPNTDTSGYHETITLASLRAGSAWLADRPRVALHAALEGLLASLPPEEPPLGSRYMEWTARTRIDEDGWRRAPAREYPLIRNFGSWANALAAAGAPQNSRPDAASRDWRRRMLGPSLHPACRRVPACAP